MKRRRQTSKSSPGPRRSKRTAVVAAAAAAKREATTTEDQSGSKPGRQSRTPVRARVSLEHALGCNRRLQEEIQQELQRIYRLQASNRKQAADIWEVELCRDIHDEEEEEDKLIPCRVAPRWTHAFYEDMMENYYQEKEQNKRQEQVSTCAAIGLGMLEEGSEFPWNPDDSSEDTPACKKYMTPARLAFFGLPRIETRKWSLDYFVDPFGFRPIPNSETLHREKIRHSTLVSQPSSSKESSNQQQQEEEQILLSKFSKQESGLVLEQVRIWQSEESKAMDGGETKAKENKWTNIARILNDKAGATSSDNDESFPLRTPWQCYCHFKQVLETQISSVSMSSSDDDSLQRTQKDMTAHIEFLFWYFVFQGPQFVWDLSAASELSHSPILWELRQKAQESGASVKFGSFRHLLSYANEVPAINPTIFDGSNHWTINPERKLVILMKIYHYLSKSSNAAKSESDSESNDVNEVEEDSCQPAGETRPIKRRKRDTTNMFTKVAAHFPNRPRGQIVSKWERSLDPSCARDLFSREEDAKLMRVMKEALSQQEGGGPSQGSSVCFADLTRTHFPNRKPHHVYSRWLTIASPSQMLEFYGNPMSMESVPESSSN